MQKHLRRTSLKNATDHLHRDLDESVAAMDLTRPAHYRAFLEASASALIAVEVLLESAGVEKIVTDWPARTRRQALLADLESLSVQARPYQLQRPLPSPSEMFGMLYVLEGSRAGAKLLLKQVSTAPHASIRLACSYLKANDAELWRSFLERLESDAAIEDQLQTMEGAIFTFALFQRSFAMASRQLHMQ